MSGLSKKLLFCISLVLLSGLSAASQVPEDVSVDPMLESQLSASSAETQRVFVSMESDFDGISKEKMVHRSERDLRPLLDKAEGSEEVNVSNSYWISNTVSLEVGPGFSLAEFASVEGVSSVYADRELRPLEQEASPSASGDSTYGLEMINATDVWNDFGSRGEDVKVAVIDTGIDESHRDLELFTEDESDPTFPGGWAEFDEEGNQVSGSEPQDCGTHGTHVSGTVAGGDESGENIGVAPGVDLMHGGVLMLDNCAGNVDTFKAGIQWAVENDADIVSASLGFGDPFVQDSSYVDAIVEPIRNANNEGTYFVGAVGNDGEGFSDSPGNVYDSLTVGAVDEDKDDADFSGGELVEDSDWDDAPSDWPDEYITPDLVAPGVDTFSSEPGDNYGEKNGTSMATPHVSGAAALIQSNTETDLAIDQIEESLKQTASKPEGWDESDADDSIDGKDTRYGEGIIDVYAATEHAINTFDGAQDLEASDVNVEAGESTVLEVQLLDLDGEPLEEEGVQVNNSFSDGLGLPETENTNSSGVAEFGFQEANAGTYNPDFVLGDDQDIDDSAVVEVEPGDATSLNLIQGPEDTVAGLEIGGRNPPELGAEDSEGNSVESVNISAKLIGGEFSSEDNFEETSSNGVSEFDSLVVQQIGDYSINLTINSSDNEVAESDWIETGEFSINPAEAEEFSFTSTEDLIDAGEEASFSFDVLDAFENPSDNHTGFNDVVEVEEGGLDPEEVNIGDSESSSGFSWQLNSSGTYNVSIGSQGIVNDSHQLEVEPGPAEILVSNPIQNQSIGEPFNLSLKALDQFGNLAESYDNSSTIDIQEENIELNRTESPEFVSGEASNFTVEVDSNRTTENLQISLDDEESQGETDSFNLTRPEPPEISGLDLNQSLMLENQTAGIKFNDTVYSFEQGDVERELNFTKPDNSSELLDIEEGGVNDWNSTIDPSDTGEHFLNLSLEDRFGQKTNNTMNISVMEPRNISLDSGFDKPSINLTSRDGVRWASSNGNITEEVPQDPEYSLELESEEVNTEIQGLNLTNDVNSTVNLQTDASSGVDFEEDNTFALETGLNFSKADVTVEASGEKAFKCSDWSFQDEGCQGSWDEVTDEVDFEDGQAKFSTSSFSAYTFGDEEEDENGDNGGSGGGGSGGGSPAPTLEPEQQLEIIEESDSLNILDIYQGNHSVEFNETDLPLKSASFEALEERSINITDQQLETDISVENSFNVDSNIDSDLELRFEVSRTWLEENRFNEGDISLHSKNDEEWGSLETSMEDNRSESAVFSSTVGSPGVYSIGVGRACYSMEDVDAVVDQSCQTFENICEVPEEANQVESCQKWNTSQELEAEMEEIQEGIDDKTISEIEEAIESEEFEEARTLIDQASESEAEGLERNSLILLGAALASAIISTLAYAVLRPIYKRKKLFRRANSLNEKVRKKADNGRDISREAEFLQQANSALMNDNYTDARRKMDELEKMLDDN